jgi:hypothetical protein
MQLHALTQAIVETGPASDSDTWSCDAVQRSNAYVSRMARLGEMGAVRNELERSGETAPELAQKWADHMEKIRHAAEQSNSSMPPDLSP